MAISINPASKNAESVISAEGVEDGPQCVLWCPKELWITTPDKELRDPTCLG